MLLSAAEKINIINSVEEQNHATSPQHVHAAATRVGYAQPQSPFQSFLPTSTIPAAAAAAAIVPSHTTSLATFC
jgi:hypothetical protein